MIEGVMVKELGVVSDEKGRVMEILRSDDDMFIKFGQVYMTTAFPGIVKGWHYHKIKTDNFSCIRGRIRLALYDARESSPTFREINEFFLGVNEPRVVRIPPGVYHGFKCISPDEAIIINTTTEPYDRKSPDEYRVSAFENDIPYDWSVD
jgi:dTDP-4-dehydrorhamnose 3,5-epimerase